MVPGRTFGDLFDAHAASLDAAGYRAHRLNACGYSLGATFTPTWMDWPMAYTGNPVVLQPGMVIFLHMILVNSEECRSMAVGETFVVGSDGPRRLSRLNLDLIVQ
jgi:Xaa-Pro dipeptidase